MAFCNALNEAARDADVYRMFARGQGYLATVKVQNVTTGWGRNPRRARPTIR